MTCPHSVEWMVRRMIPWVGGRDTKRKGEKKREGKRERGV